MKTKILVCGIMISLFVVSCSKKDSTEDGKFTSEEIAMNAKMDIANEDVQQLAETEFDATIANGSNAKMAESAQSTQSLLPACAVITRVPAFGILPTVGQLVTKTINFGITGCPMPNGNVLKGKIIISFIFNPTAITHTITYQFDGFYHNAIKFNGNKTFTRTLTAATANAAPHPIVTMDINMTATFPNGNMATRVGTRTREIIEGFTTAIPTDNIWRITGAWTTTFQNTTTQTCTITTPLIVKFTCPFVVKGVVTFVRNSNTAVLDYGNGDCDNQATIAINGGTPVAITLGN